jgi:hypothetical protein
LRSSLKTLNVAFGTHEVQSGVDCYGRTWSFKSMCLAFK